MKTPYASKYSGGQVITIQAPANVEVDSKTYTFANWTINNVKDKKNPITVAVTEDLVVVAKMKKKGN